MGKRKTKDLPIWRAILWKLMRNTTLLWPDRAYLKASFRLLTGHSLDLENPKTFNEKVQWLKLHDRRELCTLVVDKVKVKDWVAEKIGSEYLIPTLGVWDRAEDVDFSRLPDKFVIKCNHNSQVGMYICKDKGAMDEWRIRRELRKGLRQDYWRLMREMAYKDVPRMILAEELLETSDGKDLEDYKIFCMNGKARMCMVCTDRYSKQGVHMTFYDLDWQRLPFKRKFPVSEGGIERPARFGEMVRLAENLAEDFPLVRVDFYEVNGRLYFGEMTLYPGAGTEPFDPYEWDRICGDMVDLN